MRRGDNGRSTVPVGSAAVLLDKRLKVRLLGQLLPDRPIGNLRFDLIYESASRGILGCLSRKRGKVGFGRLRIGTVRNGHDGMLRRPKHDPAKASRARSVRERIRIVRNSPSVAGRKSPGRWLSPRDPAGGEIGLGGLPKLRTRVQFPSLALDRVASRKAPSQLR